MMGWRNGVLFPIAVVGDPPPGGPPGATFFSFSSPVVEDGQVYFVAGLTGGTPGETPPVYVWSEEAGLSQLAFPGLCCARVPIPRNGQLLFTAAEDPLLPPDLRFGVWVQDEGGHLEEIFDLGSQYPGAPDGASFVQKTEQLGAVSDAAVLNAEDRTGSRGDLFRLSQAGAEVVFTWGDPLPDSAATTQGVWREFAADGDWIAFRATVSGPASPNYPGGIVLQGADRTLHHVLYGGDILEGLPVGQTWVTYGGLSGDTLAIQVGRSGDTAVWLADLSALGEPPPSPSPLEIPALEQGSLLALAIVLAIVALANLRRLGKK